jgi:hypothetical protein
VDGRPTSEPVMLLGGEELRTSADFKEHVRRSSRRVSFRSIEDIAIRMTCGAVRMTEIVGGHDLREFASVQVLSYPRGAANLLNSLADYLSSHGVRAVNVGIVDAPTKLYKYVRMANRGLPIPDTIYLPHNRLPVAFPELAESFDVPFVLKSVAGGGGRSRTVVADEKTFGDTVRRAAGKQMRLLAQELVPVDAQQRLVVFGGRVRAAQEFVETDQSDVLRRARWDGARSVPVDEVPEALAGIAVAAAEAMNYDLAAVYLTRNWTTSRWQVMDISASPLAGAGLHPEGVAGLYALFLDETTQADQPQCPGKAVIVSDLSGSR